jgi:hypothetical protein
MRLREMLLAQQPPGKPRGTTCLIDDGMTSLVGENHLTV